MRRWQVTTGVALGAVVLATVGIQASDLAQGVRGNLLGSAIESGGPCGAGAVQLNFGGGALCVDVYEASPSSECPLQNPDSSVATQTNLNELSCSGQSVAEVMPWRFVSLVQAQQICARSGKRLPRADEWFQLALQLQDDSSCVIDASGPQVTGKATCASVSGVHDLVGNVWEWIDGEVVDGNYEGRELPVTGFVSGVDSDGMVVATKQSPNDEYGADYAITDMSGVYGIIRGGFFDSGTDAGIFAQNLAVPTDLRTPGIGFRCVKSL